MDFRRCCLYNKIMDKQTILGNQLPSKSIQTVVLIEVSEELKEPPFYKVWLLNDDYTPFDFVIEILMKLFHKDYDSAYEITMEIHHKQRGVAGIYPYEIATEKAKQVMMLAKASNFPLNCTAEPA